MLVAAAVCPHPPIVVPELATGASPELDDLRAACDEAVEALAGGRPDRIVVVGADPDAGSYPAQSGASMGPYGVGVRVGGQIGELPLALAIGAWLVSRAQEPWPVQYVGIEPDAAASRCLELGRELAGGAGRIALLVMADGSARRTPQSPGRFDTRAEPFDLLVVEALRTGDVTALASLDPVLAADLLVQGRAAWQVLAGAAESMAGPGRLAATLRYADAPYGVGYAVASWWNDHVH